MGKQCYKGNVSIRFVAHVNQVALKKDGIVCHLSNPTGLKMGKDPGTKGDKIIDESLTSGNASLNRS